MAGTRRAFSQIAVNSKSANSPLPKIFIGFLLVGFFLIGILLHIQTSESFFLGGGPVTLVPNWGVLIQPWELVQGLHSPQMSAAIMWGWGIEMTFLICVIGYEVAEDAVAASSRKFAGWFRTATYGLIGFNGLADYLYVSTFASFWPAIAFALITTFVVFFFGTIGWSLIVSGFSEWNRG